MSYGVTTQGFTPKDLLTIIAEDINRLNQLIDRIDTHTDSFIYQQIKMIAEREEALWDLLDDIFEQMSMISATGEYLKMFGEDEGQGIGAAEEATGTVYVTGTVDGTAIPIGTIFSTGEGTQFQTIEAVSLVTNIQMTRGATGATDGIPSPYSDVSINYISQFSDGTGVISASDYTFSSDVITWISAPAAGTTYYVWTSNEVTVEISIEAVIAGDAGNVPANTIIVNSDGISSITTVNNTSETSEGSDEEAQETYRGRLLTTRHRNWVLNNIKADVDSVSGVRASKVYQNEGVDQEHPANWTGGAGANTDYVQLPSGIEVGQTYSSGDRVLTLTGVTVNGRKVGTPGPLTAEVYYWKGTYAATLASTLMTDGEFRADDVDPNDPWSDQELKIPLNFGGLDSTLTYLIRLYQKDPEAGSYWQLFYEDVSGYSDGNMFYVGTGLVAVPWVTSDLWFKTWYKGASFTSQIAPERTATWATVKANIETTIDDGGKKAVAIQSVVSEATEVRINVRGLLYLETGYSFATVTGEIETAIRTYLNTLEIGEDVYWSRIFNLIVDADGVSRVYDVEIRRDALAWGDTDLTILDTEVAYLDDGTYGAGTSFTEG